MFINSEYEDITKYKVLTENKYCKNNNSYIEQELYDIENKVNIKRTLTFKNIICTPSQLENIKKRSILPPFGKVKDKDVSISKDDIWMEYNPDLLRGEKTKKYLTKLLLSDNKEKIKVLNNSENILKDTLLKINHNCKIPNINTKINDIMGISGATSIITSDKKYVAPLRNLKDKKTIMKKYDIHKNSTGVKLSNIPSDINDNDLKYWLSQFKISAYRLSFPKDKYTGKSRQFAFLTFNNKKNADETIQLLNGSKFDYNIISAELSKY